MKRLIPILAISLSLFSCGKPTAKDRNDYLNITLRLNEKFAIPKEFGGDDSCVFLEAKDGWSIYRLIDPRPSGTGFVWIGVRDERVEMISQTIIKFK